MGQNPEEAKDYSRVVGSFPKQVFWGSCFDPISQLLTTKKIPPPFSASNLWSATLAELRLLQTLLVSVGPATSTSGLSPVADVCQHWCRKRM